MGACMNCPSLQAKKLNFNLLLCIRSLGTRSGRDQDGKPRVPGLITSSALNGHAPEPDLQNATQLLSISSPAELVSSAGYLATQQQGLIEGALLHQNSPGHAGQLICQCYRRHIAVTTKRQLIHPSA